MADELTQTAGIVYDKGTGGARITVDRRWQQKVTVAGEHVADFTQLIGTSAEALAVPTDITDLGVVQIRNLSQTETVELSAESAVTTPLISLGPLKICHFPPAVNTIYAKAVANTAKLWIVVIPE